MDERRKSERTRCNAPNIVLLTKDLMRDYSVPDSVKNCFLNHAERWMSPVNVVVSVHQGVPEDAKTTRDINVFYSKKCVCSAHQSFNLVPSNTGEVLTITTEHPNSKR